MNKKSKLLFTVLLCTGLVFTGCDNRERGFEPKTLVLDAIKKMESFHQYEITQKTVLDVTTLDGDQIIIDADDKIQAKKNDNDIYQVTTNIEMTMGEEIQDYEIEQYIVKNNNQLKMYTKVSDEWEKEKIDENGIKKRLRMPEDIVKNYIEEIDDVTWGKTREINDILCDEVIMHFNIEEIDDRKQLVSFIRQLLVLDGLDISDDEMAIEFHDTDAHEEIIFHIYIDKQSGEIVGENWEIEALAKEIFMKAQEIEEVKAFKFSYESTYNKMDGSAQIELPNQLKTAL